MRKLRVLAAVCLIPVAVAVAQEVPRPAPDLTINLGANKSIKLGQYRDKTVVLAFILTYCSHCQAVIRGLIKDQVELGPKGLQVVAAAIEDTAAMAVPTFVRQFEPTFPVGYVSNPDAVQFLQHPPMKGFYMPHVVFIDKTGTIRAQYGGRDDLLKESTQAKAVRDKILEVMAMPASAPAKSGNRKTATKRN